MATTGKLEATETAIRERAYAHFLARGGEHGHDLEDWLRAEAELAAGVRAVDAVAMRLARQLSPDMIDEAGEESFPASDPPPWTAARVGMPLRVVR